MPDYRVYRSPHLLSDNLKDFLCTNSGVDLKLAVSLFPTGWRVLVMGGVLRDLLIESIRSVNLPRSDIDLVILAAESVDSIRRHLGDSFVSLNTFGGLKARLRSAGPVFDIWRAEDHTNMRNTVAAPTIERLLRHNLIDVDAVLWEPENDCLHDCGSINAVRSGCIDLTGAEGIAGRFHAAQVAHVLLIAFKCRFQISDNLRKFVGDDGSPDFRSEVLRVVGRKLPGAVGQVEEFWKDLVRGGSHSWPVPTQAAIR